MSTLQIDRKFSLAIETWAVTAAHRWCCVDRFVGKFGSAIGPCRETLP